MKPIIVLTNDDGIEAPGLNALEVAMEGKGVPIVVAPLEARSGCSHVVMNHGPIGIEHRRTDRIVIDGSPADCVRLALHHLVEDVDWIISGINAGGNLGTDVYHSGTVAAVRQGAILGKPGIAVSHYIAKGRVIDWKTASAWTARIVEILFKERLEPGEFWNVNLPHPEDVSIFPEIVECPMDPSPLPLRFDIDPQSGAATYRGVYQERERRPGCDVEVCFGGRIAVSRLRV